MNAEKQHNRFIASLLTALPWMDLATKQKWIENPKGLQKALEALCPPVGESLPNSNMEYWVNFYQYNFNLNPEFSGLKIPQKPKGWKRNWRLLVVLGGLTNNQVYKACKKQFPCSNLMNDEDLDAVIPTNERDPKNGTYAIWVHDNQEVGEVCRINSTGILNQTDLNIETVLERMIHELVYFSETRKHLDEHHSTLCAGSRFDDGSVPEALWKDGYKFCVGLGLGKGWVKDMPVRVVIT